MATGNFSKVNAKNYYVIYDTYKDENGEEIQRDSWDFDDLRECIRENGRETKLFTEESNEYVDRDAKELCYGSYYTHFGRNGFLTDTTIVRTIIMRSGYYEGGETLIGRLKLQVLTALILNYLNMIALRTW